LNIPNILTIFRMFLIPVYIVAFALSGESKSSAAVVFIVASITDVLDGYIARKYNMSTKVGQLLDPLADKLMQLTVVISLMIADILPVWFVIILAIKECLMITGGAVLYSQKKYVKSNIFGKLNTVILFCAMVMMFYIHTSDLISTVVLGVSAVFNLITICSYYRIYFTKLNKFNGGVSQ